MSGKVLICRRVIDLEAAQLLAENRLGERLYRSKGGYLFKEFLGLDGYTRYSLLSVATARWNWFRRGVKWFADPSTALQGCQLGWDSLAECPKYQVVDCNGFPHLPSGRLWPQSWQVISEDPEITVGDTVLVAFQEARTQPCNEAEFLVKKRGERMFFVLETRGSYKDLRVAQVNERTALAYYEEMAYKCMEVQDAFPGVELQEI